jgi:hypothetical protein
MKLQIKEDKIKLFTFNPTQILPLMMENLCKIDVEKG